MSVLMLMLMFTACGQTHREVGGIPLCGHACWHTEENAALRALRTVTALSHIHESHIDMCLPPGYLQTVSAEWWCIPHDFTCLITFHYKDVMSACNDVEHPALAGTRIGSSSNMQWHSTCVT